MFQFIKKLNYKKIFPDSVLTLFDQEFTFDHLHITIIKKLIFMKSITGLALSENVPDIMICLTY